MRRKKGECQIYTRRMRNNETRNTSRRVPKGRWKGLEMMRIIERIRMKEKEEGERRKREIDTGVGERGTVGMNERRGQGGKREREGIKYGTNLC